MKIYTLCINEESGRYIAISTNDPSIKEFSWTSELDAVGLLAINNPGITIEEVIRVDTTHRKR